MAVKRKIAAARARLDLPPARPYTFGPSRMTTTMLLMLVLLAACGGLMLVEVRGVRTTLALQFKGDIKRETRWLAQYGQSVCTPVAALLVWQIDPHGWRAGLLVLVATMLASLSVGVLKRLLGRVRPGREHAGQFLGPSWKHANYRESFPSSHSACAVALTTALAYLYPAGATTFWGLALSCAALRYLLDAHWPSDVLGGVVIGYVLARLTIWAWTSHWHLLPVA
jgi:membrane-associated phospholipid phosphatase